MTVGAGVLLYGQGGGTTTPGGGGTTTPTPTTPTTPTPTTPTTRTPTQTTPQTGTTVTEMQRPVYVSGRVQLEDGTAPSELVVIERVCGGRVYQEGYTDSRGRFTIQLGQNRGMLPDASVSGGSYRMDELGTAGGNPFGGVSERELSNCEVRANLAGYVSGVVPLFGRRSLDNPEIGSIILRRVGNVQGTTVSATTLAAPKDARKAYEKGLGEMRKRKWANARKEFEKAVSAYPGFADAWHELGLAAQQLNQTDDARRAYQKALELDPKFIKPQIQLASLAASEGQWADLAAISSRVIELDPFNYPGVYYFAAVAEFNLGHMIVAEHSARQAVKLDKAGSFPASNHILGVVLAVKGEFQEAAAALRTYLAAAPNAPDAAQARTRLAEVERIASARGGVTP